MANPEYDSENIPSRRAARAALAPRDELAVPDELPEDLEELSFDETQRLPGATVLSPAMETPRPFYDNPDTKGPRHGQNPVTDRPRESYIAPKADITSSPRAEKGGEGETAAEIEAIRNAQDDIYNTAKKALIDLGIDVTPDERSGLLRLYKQGVISMPPEAVAAIEAIEEAAQTESEYGYANWKNKRAME